MKTFKYKLEQFSDNDLPKTEWEEHFNKQGFKGWELLDVSSTVFTDGTPGIAYHTLIWKREEK